jgi:hypothetical protein
MHPLLGLIFILRTNDAELVHSGDFTEDDVSTWAGVAGQHRAEIGAEPEQNLNVVLPHVIGIGLVEADNNQKWAGIALARKVGEAVELGFQRVKVTEDELRARVIGKAYDLVVSYGVPSHPSRPPLVVKTVRRYRVHLSGENVGARTNLLDDKRTVRLATCVTAEVEEIPELEELAVMGWRLEPVKGAPALPFVVDATTGDALPIHPERCMF